MIELSWVKFSSSILHDPMHWSLPCCTWSCFLICNLSDLMTFWHDSWFSIERKSQCLFPDVIVVKVQHHFSRIIKRALSSQYLQQKRPNNWFCDEYPDWLLFRAVAEHRLLTRRAWLVECGAVNASRNYTANSVLGLPLRLCPLHRTLCTKSFKARSSWLNCSLRGAEAVYFFSKGQ